LGALKGKGVLVRLRKAVEVGAQEVVAIRGKDDVIEVV
jgi:hypothetical protein